MGGVSRAEEIARNLAAVRTRIAQACEDAGRINDVHLIVVTKTHPVSDIEILRDLGVVDVGENRDQEAAPKSAAFAAQDGRDLRWHFIGQMQSNKARSVLQYASMIHTVDRTSLADALMRTAARPIDCLIQLSVDGDAARGGVTLEDMPALVARIADPLLVRGIMAVAPVHMDPIQAFAVVARAHDQLRDLVPDAGIRCIGMSDDFAMAIHAGATHVRVGSAILGTRPVI